MLREVHEGVCGNHSGARALVHKVVRAYYYWPTIQANTKAYVCDQCQRFSNIPRQPLEYLTSMMAPWPFAQYGLNILAKAASAGGAMDEYDKVQCMPSIDLPKIQQVEGEENWMTPILIYLKDGRLQEDKDEARRLRIKAAKYVLIDEVLYKRGFSQPYLRCLAPDESNYMLRELHEGACGNHSGARALVHKVVRAGYYWATIQADAKAYVKICDQCQRFSNVPRQPSEYLTLMMAPWPFAQ